MKTKQKITHVEVERFVDQFGYDAYRGKFFYKDKQVDSLLLFDITHRNANHKISNYVSKNFVVETNLKEARDE